MNTDKNLARALKQLAKCGEKGGDPTHPRQALRSLQAALSDPALKTAIDRAAQVLQSAPAQRAALTTGEAVALIRAFAEQKLTSSAALIFTALLQPLKTLDLEAILPLAPTAKCLTAWLKVARVPKKLLEEKTLAAPELAWRSAALDWYMDKGPLKRAGSLLSDLLRKKPRPQHLPQWDEVLTAAIEKPKGELLKQVLLDDNSREAYQLESLTALLLSSPALLAKTADLLPDLLEPPSTQALTFTKLLLAQAPLAAPHRLPLISAAIARLATGILLKEDPTTNQAEALISIGEAMSRLKLATTDEDSKSRTWIIEPLKTAAERPNDNQNLTMTGARHMAIAFEKARQGLNAHAVLSMAAKNLGMTAIGARNQAVPFNPLHHEDTQGGIMPGEIVEVAEPGWTFRNAVILRALVARPSGTQAHKTP